MQSINTQYPSVEPTFDAVANALRANDYDANRMAYDYNLVPLADYAAAAFGYDRSQGYVEYVHGPTLFAGGVEQRAVFVVAKDGTRRLLGYIGRPLDCVILECLDGPCGRYVGSLYACRSASDADSRAMAERDAADDARHEAYLAEAKEDGVLC